MSASGFSTLQLVRPAPARPGGMPGRQRLKNEMLISSAGSLRPQLRQHAGAISDSALRHFPGDPAGADEMLEFGHGPWLLQVSNRAIDPR